MRLTLFKPLSKKIIRRKTWGVHKKVIVQILTPRCRQDGMRTRSLHSQGNGTDNITGRIDGDEVCGVI